MASNNSRPTVLLVDDDKDFLSSIQYILDSLNCETLLANNGLEAIELIKSRPITVVMSDIQMPKLTGVGLLEALEKSNISVPVVIMTGYSHYTEKEISNRGGVVFLNKPFNKKQLQELVEQYINLLPLSG